MILSGDPSRAVRLQRGLQSVRAGQGQPRLIFLASRFLGRAFPSLTVHVDLPSTLPAVSRSWGEVAAVAACSNVGGETSVLVVEDDEATAEFLLDNLRADGYRAASASGVGEGLRAIEVRQPDVVLLDLMLEDGHGLELLDAVRAADGLASRLDPELPVIVLSGRGGETDRVRGFQRGCDDYVGKPFSYPELHARIRAVLRRAATVRAGASCASGRS